MGNNRISMGRMKDRPQNTPLDEWPLAWLKIECASLLDTPGYILATDDEKRRDGLPATVNEMREFIRGRRIGDAILADPTLLD